MSEDYLEPSPPAQQQRRRILIAAFLLLWLGLGAYVVSIIAGSDSLDGCGGIPALRTFFIFKVAGWLLGATFSMTLARKLLAAGQYPWPTAVIFRRTRVRRGRFVKLFAIGLLVGSGLILIISAVNTALFIEVLALQRATQCT
jgi:hypothetical protein